ncbi:potassium channel family protein [Aurantiacibacter sp. MUD11]|uniref:potassium channel family protein n=1 Tax=Aurantiacibacter sp. MUD11 TaxID=3003265 RepID=UPI0022AA887D|nr:potassium channel family protein [Aurantiacibacter sp. MUD11]WAT18924.1 potassium channel family protein [Aurantiacibacter sp. MUD11]
MTSFYMHYTAMRWCAHAVATGRLATRRPLLIVLGIVFAVHLAEVLLFAIAFFAMHGSPWLGRLEGAVPPDAGFLTYFYFSISNYTTLGVGDIVPEGPARIMAGIEALMGLVLIAWSASFSYLMMEKLWLAEREDL